MTYRVNEFFCSLQGEGVRAGTMNVFVRFSGCNLACNLHDHGFDCDTEFTSGISYSAEQVAMHVRSYNSQSVIFTGGEPALQLDDELVAELGKSHYLAVETNGTKELPDGLDWICVSPKTAEHTLRVGQKVNELKYVRRAGQAIPKPTLKADHYLISPAFQPDGTLRQEDLRWCIQLVRENPTWRLSMQQHKLWSVR